MLDSSAELFYNHQKRWKKCIDNITPPIWGERGDFMSLNIPQELLNRNFQEVNFMDFYRDVFPVCSFEKQGVYEEGKYNGIIIEITDEIRKNGKAKVLRHTVTDDLEKIQEVAQRDNFCLMSPIAYAGKSRKSENARFMYALAIDVDGIKDEKNFNFFLRQAENGKNMRGFVWGLPEPTYLVSSGSGLHIYYVFEKPVPLFPNIVKELEKLKRRLTWQAWTQGATTLSDNVQYESLFQGFRMVGTITKSGDRTRAFRYGSGEKVTVEYLNFFVPEEYQARNFTYKSELTLKEAKEKYPEWYDKRILNRQPKGTWQCKRDLYDWWIRKIYGGAAQGHRYWCVMTLAAYAKKSGIEYAELVGDALGMIDFLNSIGDGTDPFTVDDVMKALEAYNDSYITYPIKTIVDRTDIHIERNKRNGLKQRDHLEIARAIQTIRDRQQGKNWRDGNGRKSQEETVREWRAGHPEGKKADCIRDTGLDKKTVYKWWDGEEKKPMREEKEKKFEVEMPDGTSVWMTKREIAELNQSIGGWHKKLPEYFVVEDEPDMMTKMMKYAAEGVRSVEILSRDEYEYLITKEEAYNRLK